MSFTLVRHLSWRYLKGKRSANAVPVLSRISMFAIAVGTAAMIILFSVFNGFEGVVKDLYKAFYPDVKITAAKGKFFSAADEQFSKISSIEGVKHMSRVLEDNILLRSSSDQRVATLKGVDGSYYNVNNIEQYITEGKGDLTAGDRPQVVIGYRLLAELGMDVYNVITNVVAYYPNPKASSTSIVMSPQSAFTSERLWPQGAFTVQDEFDGKYVLADIAIAERLLQKKGYYSSIEMSLSDGADPDDVKSELQQLLGARYIVETRYEQNRTLYMVMRAEKWAVYGILVLVLLIAAFNMVGALSLLVLEKQKDISIMKTMGATRADISSIFVTEGVLWSLIGGGTGLLIGGLICLGQQYFGWIKLGGSFIIEAYPVALAWQDFALIVATIIAIGVLASWFPAMRAARVQTVSLRTD